MATEYSDWVEDYLARDAADPYGPAREFCSNLASSQRPGSVADLGCGTGGFAATLASALPEWAVVGVDRDPAMVEQCHRHTAATPNVGFECADMTTFGDDSRFSIVTCLMSTVYSLTTTDDQVRFFNNCARMLRSGGALIVECHLPSQEMLFPAQSAVVRSVDDGSVTLSVTKVDRIRQTVLFDEIDLRHGQPVQVRPIRQRYMWPAEMDLMAAAAGLTKSGQWSDFTGTALTHKSPRYITKYVT